MNLKKIKDIKNHTMYVNIDNLEYLLKKEYDVEAELVLHKLQELSSTLNIPAIYQIDKTNSQIYTYEQYIHGESLQTLIDQGQFITEPQLRSLCISLIETLSGLHANNIIHKDIKPSNIIICNQIPYLIDFNISRIYDNQKTADTKLIGTEGYASPEQYGFTQTTIKTDIYSLGKTFENMRLVTILEPNEYQFFEDLIIQMTMLDPEQRIDLEQVLEMLTPVDDHIINFSTTTKKKFIGIIETTHGFAANIAASIFYVYFVGEFHFAEQSANFQEYPLLLVLLIYYSSSVLFNYYTEKISYPKIHKFRKTSNRPKWLDWILFNFLDLYVFTIISSLILGLIT